MSFKEVQDLNCDTTISLGGFNKSAKRENPTQVEGYFLGSKTTPNKKTGGVSKLHILLTDEGKLGVWGKTDLDKKISGVSPGTMIRVTQNGTVPTPRGEMYKFKVEVDSDNTIEVDSSVGASEPPASASGYADIDDESYEAEQEVLDEPALPRAALPNKAAASPSAAQRAKVQALLSGAKSK